VGERRDVKVVQRVLCLALERLARHLAVSVPFLDVESPAHNFRPVSFVLCHVSLSFGSFISLLLCHDVYHNFLW